VRFRGPYQESWTEELCGNLGTLSTGLGSCMDACKVKIGCSAFDYKNGTSSRSPTCILRACPIPAHLWQYRLSDPDYEGYELVTDRNCYDKLPECGKYTADGQCETDAYFMQQQCRASCQLVSPQGEAVAKNPCSSNEHTCSRNVCIPMSSVGDFDKHCTDGSDEATTRTDMLGWINQVPNKGPSCEDGEPDQCYGVCRCGPPSWGCLFFNLIFPPCKPGYVRDTQVDRRCVRAWGFSTTHV
ncbi:unnamed protein product, partial [Meganyctiphanes norvegica]